jgi:acyl-[acyl-carrier-protein] desaturase
LAGFAIDPSAMMIAASKQASNFAMPGSGIPNFTRHAVRIAREGIYGLSQFLKDVLDPVLKLWDVDHLAGLSPEAERARIDLEAAIKKLTATVDRMAQRLNGPARILT